MLRVGRIDYINCDPLFHGLPPDGASWNVTAAVPSELNRAMRNGELDVSTVSSIEYARAADSYWMLPEAGISAGGPVKSVLLLSPRPVEELDGAVIALSSESATTIVLLRILMERHFRVRPRYETWDPGAGRPEREEREESTEERGGRTERPQDLPAGPVMVIGDRALLANASESHPHVYDLGGEWRRMTGLPMTFAVICARREVAEGTASSPIRELSRCFRRNARRWPDALDEVSPPAALRIGLPLAVVRAYLLGLEFALTPLHLRGLARFFELAAEVGELAAPAPLRFLPPEDDSLSREA